MSNTWNIAKGIILGVLILLCIRYAINFTHNTSACATNNDPAACKKHTPFLP